MAFFAFVIQAVLLKRAFKKYQKEKILTLEDEAFGLSAKGKPSWTKKFRGSSFYKYLQKFKRKNTKENIFIKSFTGFLGGVILTYIYFFFFIFGLRFPLQASTYVCAIFGIVFCLGLAFSRKVRCYVFLMIPVFFSKEGRQILMTYALYLTFTGPVKNTMHNIGILSDSMTCSQEVIKRTLKQIEDTVKAPFRSIKETFEKILKSLKEALNKVKEFLNNIKRIILGILHIIKKAVSWLGSIVNFCNKKLGTPFQRCMKTFDDAIEDCKAKMGIMDFLCHVVHVVKALCYTVKFLDLICLFTEFVSESVIGTVKKKLKEFGMKVKTMFYVSIEFSHSYDYNLEATNSTKMIAETVLQKLVEKVEKLDTFFSTLGWAFSFVFVFIFFRVYYYKYKFMASDRYDNRYITKYIVELDIKRLKMNKETVLPLERRERKHFCPPTSLRLLREEQENITKALLVLSLSTFKILSFLVCDYCLYWVLFTIYQEGHREFAEVQAAEVELHVSGRGSLAEFYRKLGKALKVPNNPNLRLDPLHCLPDPIPPDKDRYIQIGYLMGICWVLTVAEAYGLRLRTIVMSHYFPDRAKERAVWLYNHILRSRGSFMRFARRQLRRKIQGGDEKPGEGGTWREFRQRIFATIPILDILFGKKKEDACLLCGAIGTKQIPLKKCRNPGCPGIYCVECYATLGNICTACQHPIEYGDISDISEERDSSEEDFYEGEIKGIFNEASTPSLDDESESEMFMTFRDLETRPKFRDLEQNRAPEFAHNSDFLLTEGTNSDDSVHFRELLGTSQAYEMAREKASSLLLKLKKQRDEKSKALTERKRKLVRNFRKRLQEQKLRRAENIDYEVVLKKAKKLSERLKKRKSGTEIDGGKIVLLDSKKISEPDKHEERTSWAKTTKLDDFDYSKMKNIVMARMKKNLKKKEKEVGAELNRERSPYSGVFPGPTSDHNISEYNEKQTRNIKRSSRNEQEHFTAQFSHCFGSGISCSDFPKENQKCFNTLEDQKICPDYLPQGELQIKGFKSNVKKERIAKVRCKLRRYVRDEIEKQLTYLR